mmetsp:Transcript_37881/g.46275  ORF Transcript_37881/g.46275 Transcript_37881/m.46275 type:complete len:84 (-) Transcript_37881:37-288(-)
MSRGTLMSFKAVRRLSDWVTLDVPSLLLKLSNDVREEELTDDSNCLFLSVNSTTPTPTVQAQNIFLQKSCWRKTTMFLSEMFG